MPAVSGTILLEQWPGEPGPATVYIRLLDTSLIDISARIIAELILPGVSLHDIAAEGLAFHLPVKEDELDARARYEVSAFLDLDGDGKLGHGDYLSTRTCPVLTRGYPDEVQVFVRRIG